MLSSTVFCIWVASSVSLLRRAGWAHDIHWPARVQFPSVAHGLSVEMVECLLDPFSLVRRSIRRSSQSVGAVVYIFQCDGFYLL
jgi:hypothetical protein